MRAETRALARPQAWLAVGIGAVGFVGMFAMYSCTGELVPSVMSLPIRVVPLVLLILGTGMTLGYVVAGRIADRTTFGAMFIWLAGMAVTLTVFALVAHRAVAGMILFFLIAGLGAVHGARAETVPARRLPRCVRSPQPCTTRLSQSATLLGAYVLALA